MGWVWVAEELAVLRLRKSQDDVLAGLVEKYYMIKKDVIRSALSLSPALPCYPNYCLSSGLLGVRSRPLNFASSWRQ